MDKQTVKELHIDIKTPLFKEYPPKKLKLKDPVLVYSDGKDIKIVDFRILMRYPLIADKFYEPDSVNQGKIIESNITLTFCPYSFSSIIYFDKLKLIGQIYDSNIILETSDKKQIVQLTGHLLDNQLLNSGLRKEDCKIMTFRNAIALYPDCIYLRIKNKKLGKKIKVNNDNNKLIYGIEYMVTKEEGKKYTAIVGKDKDNIFEYKN